MIEVWWSPAAECYRVEDGRTMFTYYQVDQVLAHLRERGMGALILPPPHSPKTAALETALRAGGFVWAYVDAK